MLWQVQGPALPGRKVNVQLLGSIHVGQPEPGSGDYFVTVGAGHLLGDNSFVSQLQSKGLLSPPCTASPDNASHKNE